VRYQLIQALGGWYHDLSELALDYLSVLQVRGRGNVQAWIVEILFTYPLVGGTATRVRVCPVLARLVIVTMLMVFVEV
jgi:hypothetical protein